LPGETIFTSSGTFTVPKKITKIDVFCVGGGGSGGGAYGYANSNNVLFVGQGGDGGGGGYTKTTKNISVTPGQTISVTIGAGANAAPFDGTYYNKATEGLPGGDTSVVGICSAAGGSTYSNEYKSNVYNNGGSGGGGGNGVYYEYGGNQLSKVGEGLGGSGIAIIRWSK
jgi:hypothetical protein